MQFLGKVPSDTAPVREVISDRGNGLLVDFFDSAKIAETVLDAQEIPEQHRAKRVRAHNSAKAYGLEAGAGHYLDLLGIESKYRSKMCN